MKIQTYQLKNTIVMNNKIGAAIKDNSKAKFYRVKFSDNEVQLASYAKNWRYGRRWKRPKYLTQLLKQRKINL